MFFCVFFFAQLCFSELFFFTLDKTNAVISSTSLSANPVFKLFIPLQYCKCRVCCSFEGFPLSADDNLKSSLCSRIPLNSLCCELNLSEVKGNPNDKNGKKACEIWEPSAIQF